MEKSKKSKKRILAFLMAMVLIVTLIIPDGFGLASDNTGVDITSLASPNDAELKLAENDGLYVSDFAVTINGTEVTSNQTVSDGDEVAISFEWSIVNNSQISSFSVDLNAQGISVNDYSVTDLYSSGVKVGTFYISNGVLYITLNSPFNEQSQISGTANIKGVVDYSNTNYNTGDSGTISIGDVAYTVTVDLNENESSAWLSKSTNGSATIAADGTSITQSYTINIGAYTNTVTLTDLTDVVSGTSSSYAVSNISYNGQTYATWNALVFALYGTTIAANQSISITYDVTYTFASATDAENAIANSSLYKNEAQVSYKTNLNNDKTSSGSAYISVTAPSVSKSGVLNSNGTITWTITVNPGDLADISSWSADNVTIADVLGSGQSYTGSLNLSSLTLSSFTPNSDGTYTLTYSTTVDDSVLNSAYDTSVTNKVTVDFTSNISETKTEPVNITSNTNYITKEFVSMDEGVMTWKIVMTVTDDMSSVVFDDGYNSNHDFTNTTMTVDGETVISNGALANYATTYVVDTSKWYHIDKYRIYFTFLDSYVRGKSQIEIYVTTTASTLADGTTYSNTAKMEYKVNGTTYKDSDSASYTYVNSLDKSGTASTTESHTIDYTIDVNLSSLYSAGTISSTDRTITITDKLDSNLTYNKDATVGYGTTYSWGSTYITISPTSITNVSYDEASNEIEFTISLSDAVISEIENLVGSAHKYIAQITYSAAVSDSYLTEFVTNGSTVSFTNTASLTDGSTATDTTSLTPSDVTTKTGTYNANAMTVAYTVEVNPDAADLLSGGDWLTATDTLTGDDLTVKAESVTIQAYKNGSWTTLTMGSDYYYTYNGDSKTLTFTIPDETYLIISYDAKINAEIGTTASASNSFALSGVSGSSMSASEAFSETVQIPTVTVNNASTYITLYKYWTNGNNMETTSATFTLYALTVNSSGTITKEETVSGYENFTVDGSVIISDLVYDKIYVLKETSAATGFATGDDYYFVLLSGTAASMAAINYPTGVTVDKQFYYGYVYYENEKTEAGSIKLTKTFTGYDSANESDVLASATFTVANTKTNATVGTYTISDFTLDSNGSYVTTIKNLEAGTYKVTETLTDVNGYTVTTTYTVGTTSGSGTDTGSFAVTSGSTTNVEITNTYTSTAATIKINKTYSSGSTVKGVTFGIYNSATPSQTSLVDTVTIAASEFSSNSAEATYTIADATAGTTYYVYELDENGNAITSNTTVFELDGVCYVVSSSGNTGLVPSAGNEVTASFTNTEIDSTSVNLSATKTLVGATLTSGQFSFILSNGTNALQTKTNTASGSVTFDAITYDASDIGTHTYYIYEDTSSTNSAYEYDESAYKVVVTVDLNTSNVLTAATVITKYSSLTEAMSSASGSSVSAITFENTYYGNGSITVTKSFSGTVNDVTFALYSGGSFVESKTLSASDYNSGTYTVTFDNLDTRNTYTVYEYASSTTYGDGDTVTIGSSTYTIAASGNTNIDLSASNTATCTFTNTETTTLVIDKTLAGSGASSTDTFEFEVTLSDTSINGTYGDMTFSSGVANVTITGAGTAAATGLPAGITYTVAETNSNGYSSVCTSSNESGTLTAGKTEKVSYTNTKTAGSLKISKTVVGTGGNITNFEFTLTIPDLASQTVTATSSIDGAETVEFNGNGVAAIYLVNGETLTFSGLSAGTTYTISEKDYTGDGYVTTVSGDESGTIKDNTTAKVAYTNTINKKATLTVTKTLAGNDYSAYTNKEFDIKIYLTVGTSNVTLDDLAATYNRANGGTVTFEKDTANSRVVATVSLKGGESITISGIPVGVEYTVAEEDYTSLGFETTYSYTSNTSGTISSAGASSVTITNTRNTIGDLILSKKVDGNSGSSTKEFVFTITLDDNSINDTYTVKSTGGNANTAISSVTFVSGIATVSLIKDQTITIAGLPNGVGYTVKETDYASDGYVTTVVDNNGATSQSNEATGNITGGSQDKVEFTNTCDTYGKLVISKAIAGNDTDSNKEFAFTVTLTGSSVDGTYAVTSTGGNTSTTISSVTFTGGTATVYLIGGQTITIDGLPNGVTYTVVEDDYSSSDGYVTTVSSSTGKVDNNERKVTGMISSGTTETATYTNTKDTYGNLTITKTVEKNGSTVLTSDSDTFTFTITLSGTNDTNILTHDYKATSTNNIYTVVSFSNGTTTVGLKSGQSVTITGIPNGVGYTVTEKTVDGYTVSTSDGVTGSTYTAGSSVSGTVNGEVGTNSQYYALFKNTLITQSLSISKVLDGNNTDANDYFAFDITLTDKNDNPISGTYDNVVFTSGIATIYLKGGETKTITELPEGTKYTVTEKSGVYDANGVENTTAENYTLSSVSGNGTVTASSASGTITDAEGATAVFTNTRNAYGSLTVSKSVSSGDTTKKFSFTITLSNTTDDSVLNGSFAATSVGASYDTILFGAGKATIELTDGESVTITGLPKGVNYTVAEDDYSSDGYVTTSVGSVGVISADTVNTAAFTNKLTSVSISKVDIADGEELVGATIQIMDSQGNIVEEWVSGTDPHVITGLIPGETYILRETVAPTGYDIATDTIFVLDEYGNIDTTKTTTSISDTGVLLVEDSLTAVSTTTETLTTETSTTETSTTETSTTETSTTETSTDTTTTTTTNTDTPDSGDHAPIVPIAILLFGSTGAATVLFIKKRRMNKA